MMNKLVGLTRAGTASTDRQVRTRKNSRWNTETVADQVPAVANF